MAFKIGKNFHIIHLTEDLKALDAWYYDVFSSQRFMPDSYMKSEVRDASLVLIGDLCIEPLAPSFHVEGWDRMPLGRFHNKLGNRFHSLAWYVDEGFDELYRDVKAAGIRCYGTGGVTQEGDAPKGALFTHPRDTYTQLEFVPGPQPGGGGGALRDPRFLPGWSPVWWADYHPLEVQQFHTTIATRDVAKARDLYVEVFKGKLVHEGEMAANQSQSAFVLVGDDLMVEFAQPLEDASPLAQDMAKYHESIYSVTYKVRDLGRAEEYLRRKGVDFAYQDDETLVSDPATTKGCTMAFTTWSVPGEPRKDWTEHDPATGPLPVNILRGI
jgi:catechol 2,3-dioxygenase-like lactoylglutathione lyase family enzyme